MLWVWFCFHVSQLLIILHHVSIYVNTFVEKFYFLIYNVFEVINMSIGDNIRAKRIERGLTQTELGKRMGITRSTVCKVEKGLEANLIVLNN